MYYTNFFDMNVPEINKASYIAALLAKDLQQNLPDEEHPAMNNWTNENSTNYKLKEEINDPGELSSSLATFTSFSIEKGLARFKKRLDNLSNG